MIKKGFLEKNYSVLGNLIQEQLFKEDEYANKRINLENPVKGIENL